MDPVIDWFNTTFKRNPKSASAVTRKYGDKPDDAEIGVTGESVLGVYPDAEKRTDKLSVDDYIRMRQTDGTLAALYNILTLPVVSTPYTFEAGQDDKKEEQKEFIEKALTDPPHIGGMAIPFDLIIADMLRAVCEGYRAFERVYKVRDDGKVVYQKLSSRDARTLYLIRADDGGFGGIHQRTTYKAHYIDIYLPPEKVFLFVYGKEKNFLYGESAFKAAAYHYEVKHKLYALANLSVQVSAIPPMIIKGPQATEEPVKQKLLREAAKLGLKTRLYMPNQFEADAYDTAKGRMDPVPLIDHHDNGMARSVLAQFIMLGGSSRAVGSWALSENHSDVFMMAEHALMAMVEDAINYYLIPDLIDLNFAEPHYPKFKFENVSPETQTLLHDAFTQLSRNGMLSPAVIKGVENAVAASLEFDMDDLEDQVIEDEKKKQDAGLLSPAPVKPQSGDITGLPVDPETGQHMSPTGQPTAGTEPGAQLPKNQNTPPRQKPVPKVTGTQKKKSLSDNPRHRELTPAEQRVNIDGIESHMKESEAQFAKDADSLIMAIKDDAIRRIEKLIQAGDIKALANFDLDHVADPYRALMLRYLRSSYEFGKKGAADELHVASPATSRQTNALMVQQATAAFDKQVSGLLYDIKNAVLSAQRKQQLSDQEPTDLGLGEVLSAISGLFSVFQKKNVPMSASVMVSSGVNLGRRDVFSDNSDAISKYQYSAIIDEVTCLVCLSLDGSVVDYAEYLTTSWQPPIHINCRCIWVQIMPDQIDQPDFSGMPKSPGGKAQPDL